MLPGERDGDRIMFPVRAYLVDAGSDGLVLADTETSDRHVDDPLLTWRGTPNENVIIPKLEKHEAIVVRLAEIGRALPTSTTVVNTHLHFDHAGDNALFLEPASASKLATRRCSGPTDQFSSSVLGQFGNDREPAGSRRNWRAFSDPELSEISGQRLVSLAEESEAVLLFVHDDERARHLRKPQAYYS